MIDDTRKRKEPTTTKGPFGSHINKNDHKEMYPLKIGFINSNKFSWEKRKELKIYY